MSLWKRINAPLFLCGGRSVSAAGACERRCAPHLVAVVWCGEDGDAAAVMHHFEALFLHLVAAHQQLQPVALEEGLGDVRAEGYPDAALAGRAAQARLGVAPQHLAHGPLIRRLPEAVLRAQLVQRHVCAAKAQISHAQQQRTPATHRLS